MITSTEILRILVSRCASIDASDIAKASITGKNEALFRDLTLQAIGIDYPSFFARPEWVIPVESLELWNQIRPKSTHGKNTKSKPAKKGIVDLVVVPTAEPLSPEPALAIEFKLWYWFDALNESKFGETHRDIHHSISQSFLTDATKLLSTIPGSQPKRHIVTVVPTFHVADFPNTSRTSRSKFLKERGFKYVTDSKVNSYDDSISTEDLRQSAIQALVSDFTAYGCPTVVGGGLTGSYRDITVTTDFVVSEIPMDLKN